MDGSLHSQSELPKASDSALHSTWNPIGWLLTAWSQGISLVIVGLLVRHETTPALSAVVDPRGRRLRRQTWKGESRSENAKNKLYNYL
jgi:hypothetical protein